MPKPSIDYNVKTNQWEFKGKDGLVKATVSESGFGFAAGSKETALLRLTGTLPATNVGTLTNVVATLTGMTGIAVGDLVDVYPNAVFTDGNIVLGAPRVPTTNVVNVPLINHRASTAGSTAAIGFTVIARKITA